MNYNLYFRLITMETKTYYNGEEEGDNGNKLCPNTVLKILIYIYIYIYIHIHISLICYNSVTTQNV